MSIENTVILIPAYRPADDLIHIAHMLHENGFAVVCIDDGSGTDYDSVFAQTSKYADVLRYSANRGKGGALKYGMQHIINTPKYSERKFIVTADADGQHKPNDIRKIADALDTNEHALVLGTRYFTGNVPLRSRFGNSVTRIVFTIAGGTKLTDTQTGLRGFSFEQARIYMDVAGDKYEYEMNMLFCALEQRIPFLEIPIETVYENDNASSHFHPIRDSYRIYRAIFLASKTIKYAFSSILAFLIDYILFLLLGHIITLDFSMELAAVCAWLCSSITNFFINRNFVFYSNAALHVSLFEYYGLAGFTFIGKILLLELLTRIIRIPPWFAKLGAEILFFISNYFIQKKIIFKK